MTVTNLIPEFRPSREAAAAKIAALLLVGSSAGVGGLYAWSTGIRHGAVLAVLAVAMALALEIAKPLAVAAMLEAGWRRFGRSLAMAALALAAITYSLTSGLSLIGAARGDGLAQRAAGAERAVDAKARRDRLASELATIPKARTAAEIQPQIAAILAKHKGATETACEGWQASVADRVACIEVQKLRAEIARDAQRQRLADALAAAETALATVGPAVNADPAASAIATNARLVGLSLEVGAVSQWLAVVPVLALEIGSALAMLLAKSFGGLPTAWVRRGEQSSTVEPAAECPGVACVTRLQVGGAAADIPAAIGLTPGSPLEAASGVAPIRTTVNAPAAAIAPPVPSAPEARLIGMLRGGAGRWSGSRRQLADRLELTRSGADALLARLAERGQIAVRSRPRRDTEVRLVGSC